jgi:hypothetical protein
MARQCCGGGRPSRRLARRLSLATSTGAAMLLLPKCPLCLAAWFTVVTGISFPASGTGWARGKIVMLCVTAVALAGASIVRRRVRARGTTT